MLPLRFDAEAKPRARPLALLRRAVTAPPPRALRLQLAPYLARTSRTLTAHPTGVRTWSTSDARAGAKGQRIVLVSVPLAGHAIVRCSRGCLWITAPGTDDLILDANASTEVRGYGSLVIQALEDAELELEFAPPR